MTAEPSPLAESFRASRPQVALALVGRRGIFAWWLGSRVIVLLSAAVVQIARFPAGAQPSFFAHPFALLGSWDGRWYEIVANRGYLFVPHRFSDPASFPLYPIVERMGSVIGLSCFVTGVLVSNFGFLVGLLALYELGCELLPEADAYRAASYLAIFPFSVVFAPAYPEGLALTLLALAPLFALRGRWLAAATCAAAATLARPEGFFLVLPLAAIAVRSWPRASEWARARMVAAVLAPPAALASFSAYLWWTLGDPRAQRSPLDHARQIAFSGVPLELWWSKSDLVVRDQQHLQSGALFARIRGLNPRAPVEAFFGDWRHSYEQRAGSRLPFALAQLGLAPARYLRRRNGLHEIHFIPRRDVNCAIERRLTRDPTRTCAHPAATSTRYGPIRH